MKILVTGAAGFVGRHLTGALRKNGHDVVETDLSPVGKISFSADISDFPQTRKMISDVLPDMIFHLASISHVRGSEPRNMHLINVSGTVNLLEASRSLDKKPRFVFVSSSQVYGSVAGEEMPITEDFPLSPVNHYGASKAAAEQVVKGYSLESGFPSIILRPFNHTGAGQLPSFLVPKLVDAFKRKEKVLPLGNLDVYRDIADVRDIIAGYSSVAENFDKAGPGTWNICSGKAVSLQHIFERLVEVTGHRPEVKSIESLQRKNEISIVYGSSEKFKKDFNWQPQYDINDTLEWMLHEN